MNKIIKTIIIIIGSLAVLISIIFNLYSLVWKPIENSIMQKGANIILGQIVQQVNQTGQVQIGDLILIKK